MDIKPNNCSTQQHALQTFNDMAAGSAIASSPFNGCDIKSPSSDVADFDLGLLSTRITDTDLLVQSLHLQTQEIASLKAQLASLNQSVARVTAGAHTDQLKAARLLGERDDCSRQVASLAAELAAHRTSADSAKGLHEQQLAAAEQRCQLADDELIDVCKQFLVQGNVLADSHLANGAHNRQYMRVAELLKRRGQNVDGLVRTTSTKRKRTISLRSAGGGGHTVATQTTPECTPVMRTVATTTTDLLVAATPVVRSCGTMTDAPEPTAVPSVCHRATQAMPTTTTRGTSTPAPARTCSVGTGFPELPSIDEIFRQMIVKVPAPLSPIAELLAADERVEIACQTESTGEDAHCAVASAEAGTSPPPASPVKVAVPVSSTHTATQSVGTITNIANIRKRIEYARKSRTATAGASLLEQLQQQQKYDIKKEEIASPYGTSNDMHAKAMTDGPVFDAVRAMSCGGNRINPHLSGLWRVLGQLIFSIIGAGRVLDDDQPLVGGPESMETINQQLRTVFELAQQQHQRDVAMAPPAEDEYQMQQIYDEMCEDVMPEPVKAGYMETMPDGADNAMAIGN